MTAALAALGSSSDLAIAPGLDDTLAAWLEEVRQRTGSDRTPADWAFPPLPPSFP